MNHYIPDDLFKLAPSVTTRQLLDQESLDYVNASLMSSVAGGPTMSLLSSLGPKANILGNDYTKHLAISGLTVNRDLSFASSTEQVKERLGTTLRSVNIEGISGVSSALSSLVLSTNQELPAVTSWAKSASNLGLVGQTLADFFNGHYQKQFSGIRESLQSVFESAFRNFDISSLRSAIFPPNLIDLDPGYTLNDVWKFVQVFGVPLMYVPRARIASRLLRAKDKPAVRAVLGQEFDNIVDDCEASMNELMWDGLFEHRDFVLEAISTIRSGHSMAAQALLTVLLDTLAFQLRPIADGGRFSKAITAYYTVKPDQQVEIEDELTMRVALVWFPIREVHYSFQKKDFDNVPREYGRHVSVHGVRKRQFSKRNCAQALMVVCSLMSHADDLARRISE